MAAGFVLSALLALSMAQTGSSLRLCDPHQKSAQDMPRPFTRVLQLQDPPMTGIDVYILQNLLKKVVPALPATGLFGNETKLALETFEISHSPPPASGVLDPVEACEVLTLLGQDSYRDNGATARSMGYLYKIHIPLHSNRSLESNATLYDADGNAQFTFTVRAHGIDSWQTQAPPWPYFESSGNVGLNMFSSDGNTPTGLTAIDLNGPEDNATEFGPYPINRFVQGLDGHAAWLMTNDANTMVRDGILLHTGNWSEVGWQPPSPMPNSLGCVHSWPDNIKTVWTLLTTKLGVQVRPNTNGQLPYPYKPQGIISVEEVD